MMVAQPSSTAYTSLPTEEGSRRAPASYRQAPPPFTRQPVRRPAPYSCVTIVTVTLLIFSAVGVALTVTLAFNPGLLSRLLPPHESHDGTDEVTPVYPKDFFDLDGAMKPSSSEDQEEEDQISSELNDFNSEQKYSTSSTTPSTTTTTTTTSTTSTTSTTTTTPPPTTTSPPTTTETTTPETTTEEQTTLPETEEPEIVDSGAAPFEDGDGYVKVVKSAIPMSALIGILALSVLGSLMILSCIIFVVKRRSTQNRRRAHVKRAISDLQDHDKSKLLQSDEELDA